MDAVAIVVIEIVGQNAMKMSFAEDNHPVNTFSAYAAVELWVPKTDPPLFSGRMVNNLGLTFEVLIMGALVTSTQEISVGRFRADCSR